MKKLFKPYFLLALALLLIFILPVAGVEKLRGGVVAITSPIWQGANAVKGWFGQSKESKVETERIMLENRLLKVEIERLNDLLHQEVALETDLLHLENLSHEYIDKEAFFRRRYEELQHQIDLQLKAIPADVVYRPSGTWTNLLWINVGSKTNENLGRLVVEKNSPVIKNSCVVGVVEYVGTNHSSVRLITDPKLCPSVRMGRGYSQDRMLLHHVEALLRALRYKQGHEILTHNLQILQQNLLNHQSGALLAKGELSGLVPGRKGCVLRGTGFNYDFGDDEGTARSIRAKDPLLQGGDLLVTTGMDGVFPAGLPIAEVSFIEVLKEGGVAYDIEAIPAAGNLDDLQRVFVLPSLSFCPD